MTTRLITLLVLILGVSFPGYASDLEKEKRWAEQIVDELFDGEVVWLNDDVSDFLAIYTEAVDSEKGTVILAHGIGVHPDWPQVINPLRVGLTESGWNTLSIQMPVLPNGVEPEEYVPLFSEVPPRLSAALSHVNAKPIVVIGHSMGAAMLSWYLANKSDTNVSAFVGVGMSAGSGHPELDNARSLEKIKIPVLDLYGELDLETVLSTIDLRANAAGAANNNDYLQTETEGADHFFVDREDVLITTVAEWIETFAGK